ncbi:MAG: RNA-binding domain-containing protein [Methanobacteriota archaeon]
MEFPFSSAVVSVHAHATEDEQRVLDPVKKLLPESVEVRRSSMKGHHGNPIVSFEARVNQRKALREFWQHLMSGMYEGAFAKLRMVVQDRVDDSCFFYIRFDKQAAYGGELVPTDVGDAIHMRFKIIAFPAEREVAIKKVLNFLEARAKHEA